jgi:hypothetical protein
MSETKKIKSIFYQGNRARAELVDGRIFEAFIVELRTGMNRRVNGCKLTFGEEIKDRPEKGKDGK